MMATGRTRTATVRQLSLDERWLKGTLAEIDAEWLRCFEWNRGQETIFPSFTVSRHPLRMRRWLSQLSNQAAMDWNHMSIDPHSNPALRRVWDEQRLVAGPWFLITSHVLPSDLVKRTWAEETIRYCCIGPVVVDGQVVASLTWMSQHPFSFIQQEKARHLLQQASEQWRTGFGLDRRSPAPSSRMDDVFHAQDLVRREIAERLHGRVQSVLLVAMEKIRGVAAEVAEHEAQQMLKDVEELLESMRETEIRPLSHRLYPGMIHTGVRAALLSLSQMWAGAVRVDIETNPEFDWLDAPLDNRIAERARLALYFVAEEAVLNAVRHGQATAILVRLECQAGQVIMRIEDNGSGLDPSVRDPGIGIESILARLEPLGGHYQLSDAPSGQGALFVVTLPLEPRGCLARSGDVG
jgi:signal transduction histidine kinase